MSYGEVGLGMSFFVTFFSRKSQLQKRNVQALFTIFIWTVNGTIAYYLRIGIAGWYRVTQIVIATLCVGSSYIILNISPNDYK